MKVGFTNLTWRQRANPQFGSFQVKTSCKNSGDPEASDELRHFSQRMVASFFSKRGHVATIQVEDRCTVNAVWYVNHCTTQVLEVWRNKRPKIGLRVYFDTMTMLLLTQLL